VRYYPLHYNESFLRKNKIRVCIVPRWRGKYFDEKHTTNWGGQAE
jgi:hypothetical protein